MRKFCALLVLWTAVAGSVGAQEVWSLDSLRALALRNNKNLLISRDRLEAAGWEHRAARTAYLPKLSADGTYIHNQKAVHLLSDDTRNKLNNMGTTAGEKLQQMASQLAAQNPQLAALAGSLGTPLVPTLNDVGERITDAFKTNTYNVWAGALVLTQPLYMGGKIKAYDRITDYTRSLLGAQYDHQTQEVLYSTDQAYWQVVSLASKRRLAESYVSMLKKLDEDIQKMYREGVVTKASTLNVSVKLNEAEVALLKVDDGLTLSRMVLCQVCGLDVDTPLRLEDELSDHVAVELRMAQVDTVRAYDNRMDLKMLEHATKLAEENVKMVRGLFLPSLAAFGGYNVMNPNVYNGFANKFAGNFNVGVALHMPLWNWGEGRYRVKAAKALVASQRHLYDEAKEKINLQLHQAKFKVDEAQKKLLMTQKNQEKAEENLHYAEVGFREGVIGTTDVLEAQTAWLAAKSEQIDAEIDVKLTEIYLKKAVGERL